MNYVVGARKKNYISLIGKRFIKSRNWFMKKIGCKYEIIFSCRTVALYKVVKLSDAKLGDKVIAVY